MGKAWDLRFTNLQLKQSGAEEEEEEVGCREREMGTGKKRHSGRKAEKLGMRHFR